MSVLEVSCRTPAELGCLLESVDPAAILVAPRMLRRIIKYDRKLTHLGLQVPHRKSYVIGREALLRLVSAEELGIDSRRGLPDTLLLLYRPEPEKLAEVPPAETLVKYWRLLFHARVHQALASRFHEGAVTTTAIRWRIHQIGQTEFAEARTVMRQEKFLLPPHDEHTVYEEFAALFLELRWFANHLLAHYFPALEDYDLVDRILAEDVDAAALFAAARLPGAPDPLHVSDDAEQADLPRPAAATTLVWSGSEKKYQSLMASADKAAAKGNGVRAAIRRGEAMQVAPPLLILEAQERARAEIHGLILRLQKALQLAGADLEIWQQALGALLSQAVQEYWPAEARLLYDLQKICVDHERPIYRPDLVEWVYSGFRHPLVRPLPNQPLVLAVKHLRVAVGRLPAVRVTDADRQALSHLLHEALHHAEDRLRDCYRAPLGEALARVGLQPHNLPEGLGRTKLVEELLDRITERGFLNMSDLRDAVARNQLKLDDLTGPRELVVGDPLIRANRALADSVTEVYRRGEFYLRWLQRGSALAFGTFPGRWLTLFVALPFLGAFATIVGVDEILHLCGLVEKLNLFDPATLSALGVMSGALGLFYLPLLHLPKFRQVVWSGLKAGGRAARTVFVEVPVALFRLSGMRRFLQSRPFLVLVRYVFKPLPFALLTWVILAVLDFDWLTAVMSATAVLLALGLLINSRLGRDVEEAVIDRTVRNVEVLQGVLPGLFLLVMNFFRTILEGMDRFFYAVDEWLRFRAGEGRLVLAAKIVAGFVWFLLTYVIRLYVNVFIEPTFNPIKHFPVVTVAAKILVPFWVPLLALFEGPFLFLGRWPAFTIAFIVLHSIPGAAGFLVWEFKENWRLYRANRPGTLRPEAIGHHGETMLRFMKPGFHSGTLPKLYAKLRRAERKAQRRGTWKTARRLREKLHHVEESIRYFTEREFVAFFAAANDWTPGPVRLVRVHAGSNRVHLEIFCGHADQNTGNTPDAGPCELHFEDLSGWLVAGIAKPGWLLRLSAEEVAVFTTALAGFYQKAGVNFVREQIEASLGPACPPYDLGTEGLIVWTGPASDCEVIYRLDEEPVLHPRLPDGTVTDLLPTLAASRLLMNKNPIAWSDWVAAWGASPGRNGKPLEILPQAKVLAAEIFPVDRVTKLKVE